MENTIQSQVMDAVESFENEINPLTLKTDHSAILAKEYGVQDATIADLANKYLPLKIAGIEDRNGYALVHTARMEVKSLRNAVEAKRKDLKADSLAYGRAVDGEAKRITGLLAPIETHLEAEERAVDAAKDAIKAEAQRKADARNQGRVDALLAVGATISLAETVLMTDETFASYLALATKANADAIAAREAEDAAAKAKAEAEAAETARKAKEEADARETERKVMADERAKMDAAHAENDRIAAELRAQQDEIDAQRRSIEKAAKDEQDRKDREARVQSEAERVIREAKEKADRDTKAEADRKAQAEANAKATEAARPDADKLRALANAFDSVSCPDMATKSGRIAMAQVTASADQLVQFIEMMAKGLTEIRA